MLVLQGERRQFNTHVIQPFVLPDKAIEIGVLRLEPSTMIVFLEMA